MPAADLAQLAIAFDVPVAPPDDSLLGMFDDGPRETAVLAHFLTLPSEFRTRLERFLLAHPRAIAFFDDADIERMLQLRSNQPRRLSRRMLSSPLTMVVSAVVVVLVGFTIGIALAVVMPRWTPRPSRVSEAITPTPSATATTLLGAAPGTPIPAVRAMPTRLTTPTATATATAVPTTVPPRNTSSATISALSTRPPKLQSTRVAVTAIPSPSMSASVRHTSVAASPATAESTTPAPAMPTASPTQSSRPPTAAAAPAGRKIALQGTWRITESNVVVGTIVWAGNATVSNSNTIVMDLHKESVGGQRATPCEQETNLHLTIPISASAQRISYKEINCQGISSTGEVHVAGLSANRGLFSGTFWQNGMDIGFFDARKEE